MKLALPIHCTWSIMSANFEAYIQSLNTDLSPLKSKITFVKHSSSSQTRDF